MDKLCYLRKILVILALILGSVTTPGHASELPISVLKIESETGIHTFMVEVAANNEARRTGLMLRQSLSQNAGMLFVYKRSGVISMWMKNTYISLDMIFVNRDGAIVKIAENTEPLSLEIISSEYPITMVLEVSGGSANRLGVKIGDHVEYQGAP